MNKPTFLDRNKAALTALLPIVIASVAAPASAQMLEEVIVTARKRVESMQDTPVAVSVFSADSMRAAQINNISDLAQHVPGLSNKDGDKESGLTIRGVGARVPGAKIDPGVGIYVDGIFIPRSDTQLLDVVSIESIQVLRGPQGTLFGKNTAGGALLLSTQKPGDVFTGEVKLGLGDYDRQSFSVRLDGPIIDDKLMAALTVDTRKEDGYMKDHFTGIDYGDIDRKAVVGQLRYLPTDNLTIDLIALWGEQKENAAPSTCFQFNDSATLQRFRGTTVTGTFGDSCLLSEAVADNEKVTMDPGGLDFTVTNKMAGLTIEWDIDDITLKSITGYLKQDDLRRDTDSDATPYLSISNFSETARQLNSNGIDGSDESRRFISQEFNLFGSAFDGKLDYTLGIYGSDEKISDQVGGQALSLGGWLGIPIGSLGVSTLPPALVGFASVNLVELTSQSAAAFGQFIYYFSDMWQLTLGGRYTWEEKKIDQDNFLSTQASLGLISEQEMLTLSDWVQPLIVNPETPKLKDDKDWNEFSPSATITMFAPDSWTESFLDSGMFYLTYSEGFKAGGFSDFGLDNPTVFSPETVKSTEFGFKMEMADHRVRLNAALYSMDYDDMQLQVTRIFGEFDVKPGITNAGKAEMKGAELELTVLPIENLYLSFTASYIDAEYKEFEDEFINDQGESQLADRTDEPFAYLPEQGYSWIIQYDWDTSLALITPRVSGYYKDEIYLGLDPAALAFEKESTLDSYTIWNARIAIQPHQVEGLEIAVYADNFTDETYYGSGIVNASNIGAVSAIRGKPRTYGIDFYYNW